MNRRFRARTAYTILEVLVVFAIVSVLASLALSALSRVKKSARKGVCLNHLRQIGCGIRMYSDDSDDALPTPGINAATTNFLSLYSAYKAMMRDYLRRGGASTEDKLFACPSDEFYPSFVEPDTTTPFYIRQSLHQHPIFDYSSYAFSGGDNVTRIVGKRPVAVESPGLTGLKLSSVKDPVRTVLIAEASALAPWSWHDPQPRDVPREALTYNDARNMVCYVDGHVGYTRIYWNEALFRAKGPSFAMSYDPPPGYDYKWSGN